MYHEVDSIDPGQAALIVKYGRTPNRCRLLDQPVILLGRSVSCDMVLSSPEVAPVQCVLAQTAEGWQLRDCGGRAAARINGGAVQNCLLCDGDSLQIGSFSFEVRLPAAPAAPEPSPKPANGVPSGDTEWFASRQAGLDRRSRALHALESDVEQSLHQLREGQDELTRKRAELEDAARIPCASAESAALDRRSAELVCFARYLQRERARLAKEAAERDRRSRAAGEWAESLRLENEKLERALGESEREGERLVERLECLAEQSAAREQEFASIDVEALREEIQQRDARIDELEQALRGAEQERREMLPSRESARAELGGSWPDTDIRDKLAWVRRLKEEMALRRQGGAV
jgi:hypothetical protein